jgi:nitrogenase-associated protein
MAQVLFYGKPRCATNQRQRGLLEAAGHEVRARDLLKEPWTAQRLREFFGALPVAAWFNPAAPRVKSGELDIQRMTPEQALEMMLVEPVLIRRPLLQVGTRRIVGFDPALLQEPVGDTGIETCLHERGAACAAATTGRN